MATWAEDPELLATFRAEVEDRLASLQAGLLQLESHPSPRQLVAGLFRDAHTVKGSARMLGLHGVLDVAHSAEDLLGALRDGRFEVRRDHVDLLLAAVDGIGRAIPGARHPATDDDLAGLVAALRSALAGDESVPVPRLAAPMTEGATAAEQVPVGTSGQAVERRERAERGVDSIRVTSRRVYDLLDVVGEAELDARRVEQNAAEIVSLILEHGRWLRSLREAAGIAGHSLPPDVELAVHRLIAAGDQLHAAGHALRERVDDVRGRFALVRDGAMGLAMVPVRRVAAAFPRLVRDVAGTTGKDVRLVLDGEDVELDKKVLDGVADALKHLVINAVDHGCESPEERVAAGKPPRATVTVSARSAGGTVVLEVVDDGRGIDEDRVRETAIERGLLPQGSTLSGQQLFQMLFVPAFSTAEAVTSTSGRGVGLDVVRTAVEDLGGSIEVTSEPGRGTTFILTLPITLGVLRCLLARVGGERYAVPVPGVVESVSLRDVPVDSVAGAPVIIRHGVSLPLLDLAGALGVDGERDPRAALIVRHSGTQDLIAWSVDRLDGELELVVKDLGSFVGRLPLVTGATIDGDGSVVCLVDLRELADRATGGAYTAQVVAGVGPAAAGAAGGVLLGNGSAAQEQGAAALTGHQGGRRPRVLVVEDSVGVRELERVILEGAGYEVITAVDGLDGVQRMRGEPADLVLSDVEMPGMDGFTLTRTMRRTRGWEQVPVVIMTSRGDEGDRRAGLEAGANAYLLKSDFDQNELVETVRRLVGR